MNGKNDPYNSNDDFTIAQATFEFIFTMIVFYYYSLWLFRLIFNKNNIIFRIKFSEFDFYLFHINKFTTDRFRLMPLSKVIA